MFILLKERVPSYLTLHMICSIITDQAQFQHGFPTFWPSTRSGEEVQYPIFFEELPLSGHVPQHL